MTARARPGAKISAVVSDVDGTLVTDDKTLTAGAAAAVAALDAAGIAFAVVSSRPPRGLRKIVASLGITTPIAGFNGGLIAKPDLSPLVQHFLRPDIARHTIEKLDDLGLEVWVFAGEDWLLRRTDGPYVGLERHTIGFGPKVVEDFAPFLGSAAKIVGVSADFDHLARCEQEVRLALADEATVVRSQSYYLDITHPLANKGVALASLAELLDVSLAEIAVIGDGANDVAMFERAGLSIAMGNAAQDVRQAADLVTASNGEDGFAAAVERFILAGARPSASLETAQVAGRA
jgi:Cof subfamily protein (haloacid dehalogenase superfamily)